MTNILMDELSSKPTVDLVLQYLVRESKPTTAIKKAIILLHGVGSNEKDLFGLANQFPDDFLVIAPRGQFILGPGRYAWFDVDFSTGKPIFNAEQEASSRKMLIKFIAEVKHKYTIDELYLGGFSQGGIMSYSIGLTQPKEFKGIICLSGRLLMEIRPSIIQNDDLIQLKIFVAHGVQDNTLKIDYARDAKSYLEILGVQLSYHEYNMGHQVTMAVIDEMMTWLSR